MGLSTIFTGLKRLAYEGFRRHTWQHPDEVIELLGIRPGATVADLGSGTGYFTFRLAEAVGPSGRVYAVDVDRGLNAYIAERARREGRDNVIAVRAESGDASLPDGSVDLVFSCNAYHHLENRVAYFRALQRCVRADGRVA